MAGKKKGNNGNFIDKNMIKDAREHLKRIIDEMTDEEFLDFSFTLLDIANSVAYTDFDDSSYNYNGPKNSTKKSTKGKKCKNGNFTVIK